MQAHQLYISKIRGKSHESLCESLTLKGFDKIKLGGPEVEALSREEWDEGTPQEPPSSAEHPQTTIKSTRGSPRSASTQPFIEHTYM
jgi:hypothetical protein